MKVNRIVGTMVAAVAATGAFAAAPAGAAPSFTPLNTELLPAMQRDLGLTHDQAIAELAAAAKATGLEQTLRGQLGDAFGGAFFDSSTGKLEVGVTDAAKLPEVRASGAEANLVRFSARQLDSTVDQLNAREPSAPASITSWGVDAEHNRVTVTVTPGGQAEAEAFLDGFSEAVVVESAEVPRPLYDVEGGDAYYIAGQAHCSIGFSVTVGFLSAGHCATVGSSITGYNQVAMGSFSSYRFPGADYSLARVNSNWTPRGVINNGTRVSGSTEATTGTSVCKSGSTTGWTCGTIQAKNQTVRYAEGTVTGMIQTNVRAQAGDSGGSLIAGNQAQGLLSGGNTSTTYFYPVRTALSATGSTLVTS